MKVNIKVLILIAIYILSFVSINLYLPLIINNVSNRLNDILVIYLSDLIFIEASLLINLITITKVIIFITTLILKASTYITLAKYLVLFIIGLVYGIYLIIHEKKGLKILGIILIILMVLITLIFIVYQAIAIIISLICLIVVNFILV